MGIERPLTGPGNEYYDAYLRETQVAHDAIVDADPERRVVGGAKLCEPQAMWRPRGRAQILFYLAPGATLTDDDAAVSSRTCIKKSQLTDEQSSPCV